MNLALRLFAGIIDLLQFIFFIVLLAFQFMTPVGGGITGAATGAYVCWSMSGGIMEGIANAAACAAGGGILGAGFSTFAIPAGIAIDIALSGTFGVLLLFTLWVTGRFSFMAIVAGFTGEMLPGINAFIPGWSLLVHRSIKAYKRKQALKEARGSSKLVSALSIASMVPGAGAALRAARPALPAAPITPRAAAQPTTARIPLQTRNFDGIKPANDNHPRPYAQAA